MYSFYKNKQYMLIYFFPNDGCAVAYCISRVSLLDMNSIYSAKKSPLCQVEFAFSDIWIFLTQGGGGEGLGETSVVFFRKADSS